MSTITSTITSTVPPATFDPIAEACRLVPEIRDRALEAERLRTMPEDLVDRFRAARLFQLALPRSLGGLELDPLTIVSTIEMIAHADGSAGWSTMVGNGISFLSWLPPDVARGIIGDGPVPTLAGVFAPTGRLVPDGDSVLVDGRWQFASGCLHAEWFMNGGLVMDGPIPRFLPDGSPDWQFVVMPRAEVEIIDTWEALGLRGTGSHDVAATGVRVARERMVLPFSRLAAHDGPLYRLPFYGLLGVIMVGVPLGIAQRALDEVVTLAPTKRRAGRPGPSVAEDSHFQVRLARAESRLRAARAYVVDRLGALWDVCCNGDEPSRDELATMQMATLEALAAATEAVDMALHSCGASVVYSSSPVQRCFRDVHTIGQHIAFADDALHHWATSRLGLPG